VCVLLSRIKILALSRAQACVEVVKYLGFQFENNDRNLIELTDLRVGKNTEDKFWKIAEDFTLKRLGAVRGGNPLLQ
jgi:hypothetical protein